MGFHTVSPILGKDAFPFVGMYCESDLTVTLQNLREVGNFLRNFLALDVTENLLISIQLESDKDAHRNKTTPQDRYQAEIKRTPRGTYKVDIMPLTEEAKDELKGIALRVYQIDMEHDPHLTIEQILGRIA